MYSASLLVMQSASQLLYLSLYKIEKPVTPGQYMGNAYAHRIIDKEHGIAEKRGIVKVNDDLLFFSIDMVKDNKFIEIKMVRQYQQWYLHNSIIQATLYASLLSLCETLDTPLFMQKIGVKQEIMKVPDKYTFELWFGDQHFRVYKNKKILKHYFNKIKIISEGFANKSFNACRLFDAKFKHNEFSIYKPKYKSI